MASRKKRFITIQILPEGSGEAWTFRLRRPFFEFLFYAFIVALFAAGFAAVKLTQIQGKVLLANHMALRNQELLARQQRMGQIEREIAAIAEKERAIRSILQAFLAPSQELRAAEAPGREDIARLEQLQEINRRLEIRGAAFALERKPNIWPLKGIVTQRFSQGGSDVRHDGIDIMAEENAVVVSAARGMVVAQGWDNDLGQYVRVNHDFDVETVYGHLARATVRVGDQLGKGDPVGVAGNTGRSLGPHLHFEIILRGRPVDPISYLE